jgi:hemoglobin-like flavoprotein
MTPNEVAVVSSTVHAVDLDALVDDFYRRAFAADPEVAAMFTSDPVLQRQRFALELETIVDLIRDIDSFRTTTAALGARHRTYGVRSTHYRTMGDALLASLAAALGPAWTPAVEAAWTRAYSLISESMLAGALEGRPPG